ncbi:MAG: cation:proton antiporter [Arachnia sp.]
MELLISGTIFVLAMLVVSRLAQWLHVSAPLLLMLVGLGASFLPFIEVPPLQPSFILLWILPPLLHAAALNTSLIDFRRNIAAIGWLSIGLVIATALAVGVVASALLGLPLPVGIALGAVVAPPDAVAATAVAKKVGLPRQVTILLEGESLVNDATALVLLRTSIGALGMAIGGWQVAGDFAWAAASAVVLGYIAARLVGLTFHFFEAQQLRTALSLLVPFAVYVPVEEIGGSGVLAVVVAGLVLNHRAQQEQDAQSRVAQKVNWSTISWLLEHAVFLLVGLQTKLIFANANASAWPLSIILLVSVATLATAVVLRILWTLGSVVVSRKLNKASVPGALVVGWAGMRGVVTLAAALTLPFDFPAREVLVFVALFVTVGTLLGQGLTLPALARRLGTNGPDAREDAVEQVIVSHRASVRALHDLGETIETDDEQAAYKEIVRSNTQRLESLWDRLNRQGTETPEATQRQLNLEMLQAQRQAVLEFRTTHNVDQALIADLLSSLDIQEAGLQRHADKSESIENAPPVASPHDAPCRDLADAPLHIKPATMTSCTQCEAEGVRPEELALCLECGHIGCMEERHHARQHFEETGHPVLRSFTPGESWRRCLVHNVGTD